MKTLCRKETLLISGLDSYLPLWLLQPVWHWSKKKPKYFRHVETPFAFKKRFHVQKARFDEVWHYNTIAIERTLTHFCLHEFLHVDIRKGLRNFLGLSMIIIIMSFYSEWIGWMEWIFFYFFELINQMTKSLEFDINISKKRDNYNVEFRFIFYLLAINLDVLSVYVRNTFLYYDVYCFLNRYWYCTAKKKLYFISAPFLFSI